MQEGLGVAYIVTTWIVPILLAITLHEAAHGFVAAALGDDTAKRQGRVTLNPFAHIDLFGTVLLPALLLLAKAPFLFGYAKPVPVNFGRLRSPRRDMVLVALAGPGMNLALAFVAVLLFHIVDALPESAGEWVKLNLRNAIVINLLLAVFNMLPLPPLDGGRVAVGLLPDWLAFPLARLERFGVLILLGILFLLPPLGRQIGLDLNLFSAIIGPAMRFLYNLLATLGGLS